MNESRNAWLDVCRALAILLVLLSHGRFFLRPVFPWTDDMRFGGFLGVELFFVLSGFLIGGILIRSSRRASGLRWLPGFYARRWFRTLPSYYLFLALNVLFVWLAIRPGPLDEAWKYALFAQNLISPSPLFFPEAWSLAVEEIFYLLFPVLFLAVGRALRIAPARAILLTAVLVIVLALVARLLVADRAQSWDDEIRKVVFLRLDALMFGVLLAWLHDHRHPLLRQGWAGGAAVLLFLAGALYFVLTPQAALNASYFAKTLYLSLVSLGCAGVLIVGQGWNLPLWMNVASSLLARLSYAAYLTNIPVAMILLNVGPSWPENPTATALSLCLAFFGFTLATAYLLHRWVERPFYRIRDRLFPT